MASFLLSTVISSLKAFLAFEREYKRNKVFLEDERGILENAVDLLQRIKNRTVGVFGEPEE